MDPAMLQNLNIIHFNIGSSYWVKVTHINNPDDFYVQPLDYNDFLPTLETCGEMISVSELHRRSETRLMVVYKSKLLKRFIRGQILSVTENTKIECKIMASDHGFIEVAISINQIFVPYLDDEVPGLATRCKLADCRPLNGIDWTQGTIDAMKFYVGNEKAKMTVRGNILNFLTVELINTCPDDIATMLAITGYSVFGYGQNAVGRYTSFPAQKILKFKQLTVNEVLLVRVLYGKSLKEFYVAQCEEYQSYFNGKYEFKHFCQAQSTLTINDATVGKPVVAVDFCDRYERAIIREVMASEERVKVQLVDWGNTMDLHISRLKFMPNHFYSIPATAIYCVADDNQVRATGLPGHLLCPGFNFYIKIKQTGERLDAPHFVDIYPVSAGQSSRQ